MSEKVNIFKEEGQWPIEHVSKDIVCKNCKYQKPPCTVMGKTCERYTHSDCLKYDDKPKEILWENGDCLYFKPA